MDGIYFKEGIYVLIDTDTQNDICVYDYSFWRDVYLYGGRIKISPNGRVSPYLSVDGISIIKISYNVIDKDLTLPEIVSHLNAIETNGVDAFLEHYKKSIEFLYGELKEINQKTETLITSEQDDSKVKSLLSELENIRKLLFSVLIILFSLCCYMTAGLENEKVISVCQSIMDSLS